MRKYFLIAAILAVATVVFPLKSYGQTNPFIYNNNAYLEYARAARRAKAMKAKNKKKVVRKKTVRRKSRRVSHLEYMIDPKFGVDVALPKRISIA